ncbi:MAG: hypothetical protein HY826_07100 [Actinobacteria bacterium]|nr:hypothetical protein [Actinomycetota bacterium]
MAGQNGGQRVLVSGMGSELGSLVAVKLEAEPWVGSLMGIDVDPPRRRLRRAEFHLLATASHDRIVELVTGFNPHVLLNISVWEPDARVGLSHARRFTAESAQAIIAAAADCRALEAIVMRSGLEVYGRGRGTPTRPDESAPLNPTSEFGKMLTHLEEQFNVFAMRNGIALGTLRLAPVLGKHVPSPLGRLLRQPVVPYSALADAPFAVVQDGDAADAFVAAAARRLREPANLVATGAITALQSAMRGRRIPFPLLGPGWGLAGRLSHVFGAPIPDHVVELLHRGRLGDGSRATELLGVAPTASTPEVIDHLYAWESIVRVGSIRPVVA